MPSSILAYWDFISFLVCFWLWTARCFLYLLCFISHFSKWLFWGVELCHYSICKVQRSASGTEIPVSQENNHAGTQGLIHLWMMLLLFLLFLHPGASLGMKIGFLCLIGEIFCEGSCCIQRFSAGSQRGEFLNSCVSKKGHFSSFIFYFCTRPYAFSRIIPLTYNVLKLDSVKKNVCHIVLISACRLHGEIGESLPKELAYSTV